MRRLVYPCPLPSLTGLGTHATVDLSGGVRFGPDATYITAASSSAPRALSVRDSHMEAEDPDTLPYVMRDGSEDTAAFIQSVYGAITRYIDPAVVDPARLRPDYLGYRPKLTRGGEPARDFYIATEKDIGLSNVVTLAGIESPGLTASPAIADHVASLLYEAGDPYVSLRGTLW